MANTIQVKRGAFASLPTLAAGEWGFSTDTKQVHIGDGSANHEVLMKALYDANSILAATADNTPAALSVGASTFVGRKAAGNISAISVAEALTLLDVESGADVTDATNVAAAGAVMEADWNAKGDIMAASADNTPVIVTAGANGKILTAASGEAGGIEWADPAAAAAHKDSHDPNDGADKLDTAAAAEISVVVAAGAGASHSFARADHIHSIVHAITDNHIVTIDDADAADNDFAKFTANGLEGRSYAETLADLSGTATAAFSMNSQKITSMLDPTGAQDAATKAYVDSVAQGLNVHDAVVCATTANIDLTGEETLDGITTSTDRVLVKDQTDPTENGIYVSGAVGWTRAADMNEQDEVAGSFIFVSGGTTLGNTGWVCTNEPETVTIDTDNITFSQFSDAGYITASGGLTKTGNDIAPNGNLEDLNTLGIVASDGQFIVGTGAGAFAYETPTTVKTTLGLVIGTNVLAEQTIGIADNNLAEVDGTPVNGEVTVWTTNGLDSKSESEFKELYNMQAGVDFQAYNAILTDLAGLTQAENKIPYFNADTTASLLDLATSVGAEGSDTTLVSEQGIREAITTATEGVDTLLELTDTPADYTDDGLKILRVNTGATAVEFVNFASSYLEASPTEDLATKAATSQWSFDHNAASTGVHGAAGNTLLNSGSTIDGGSFPA